MKKSSKAQFSVTTPYLDPNKNKRFEKSKNGSRNKSENLDWKEIASLFKKDIGTTGFYFFVSPLRQSLPKLFLPD